MRNVQWKRNLMKKLISSLTIKPTLTLTVLTSIPGDLLVTNHKQFAVLKMTSLKDEVR